MVASRHRSREKALHSLYRFDIEDKAKDGAMSKNSEAPDGEEEYDRILVEGVTAHIAEIDRLIEESSEHWTISRMAIVDRNILRIGVFEFRFRTDVPGKVVIDEAVELAKRYGSEESGAFINGVLDKVLKDILTREATSQQLN